MSASGGAGGAPGAQGANEAAREPLTIYPKHPTADDVYYIGGAWAPACITAEEKRLTIAECAAEFHSARADYTEASNHPSGTYWTPLDVTEDATAEMAMKRAMTFLRLASRPHHDDEDES